MTTFLKLLLLVFIGTLIAGFYLQYQQDPLAEIVIGLDVLFLSFVLMPLFIYHRYRGGKYKKYVVKK